MNCNICKQILNQPGKPWLRDCGGDCLKCMALIAHDPDCLRALKAMQPPAMTQAEMDEVDDLLKGLK
jgi:hypothetical protein